MKQLEALRGVWDRAFGPKEKRYAYLSEPSAKNILTTLDILRKHKTSVDTVDGEGNHIEILPTTFKHEILDFTPWFTEGITVKVKQKLPVDTVGGLRYLSTTTQTESDRYRYGAYKREGDLRTDYIQPNGIYESGIVDGNDDGFGLPTGEWFIDGQAFFNATARAYKLLTRTAFGIGDVPPLTGDNPSQNKLPHTVR